MNRVSPAQKKLLPSDKDISSYQEKGWFRSPIILPDDLLDQGIEAAERFYRGERDQSLPKHEGMSDDKGDPNSAIWNNEFSTLQMHKIREIGFHPLILATASLLSGSSELRLLSDSLINKRPRKAESAGVVGWHTDKAYWPTCTSDKLLTVWIPFQDCDVEMGPVEYINNSQLWRKDERLNTFYGFNKPNLNSLEKFLEDEYPDYSTSKMTLKRGQVSFHNCHLMHCSRPNISQKNRLALAVHLQDESNRYQTVHDSKGDKIIIGYDKMCRKDINGNPDYSDPEFFPKIWPLT